MEAFDPGVTVALVTYNSAAYVRECLGSVQRAAPDIPILVIDNASADGTQDIVRAEFPGCRLVGLPQNIGHSAACNLAFQLAATAWVLLLDHDTAVPEGWLEPLLAAAAATWPMTAMVSSRAVFAEQERLHHDGGDAHFVGHMTLRHGFAPLSSLPHSDEVAEVGAQASTSLLVHRARALAVGGFDPRFFIYLNDFDLSLRMRLRGWRCYVAPRSVVYHRQGNPETSWRGRGAYPERRAYLMYRNRWMLIAKLYARRTLLVCLPALLAYELVLLGAAARKSWLRAYMRALCDVVRAWPALMIQRARVQRARRISDRELLSAHGFSFVPGLVNRPAARLAQSAFERGFAVYWRVVAPLI
ncbi:MAG TPA: glycosyltransferase family 2 protein [Roseiflexaceae bacterium]|nr:glycosyltransferase family 2 protein [Roseiflexaceae bacterium]